jgi:hypothetical protein
MTITKEPYRLYVWDNISQWVMLPTPRYNTLRAAKIACRRRINGGTLPANALVRAIQCGSYSLTSQDLFNLLSAGIVATHLNGRIY